MYHRDYKNHQNTHERRFSFFASRKRNTRQNPLQALERFIFVHMVNVWTTEAAFSRLLRRIELMARAAVVGGTGNGSASLGGSLSPRGVWTCFELEGVLYQCTALPGMYEERRKMRRRDKLDPALLPLDTSLPPGSFSVTGVARTRKLGHHPAVSHSPPPEDDEQAPEKTNEDSQMVVGGNFTVGPPRCARRRRETQQGGRPVAALPTGQDPL
ncbi:hypothetical protein EYF80_028079 [Liparis tanakae]|uniref:Uncharacterized protein n=1 Tax=Liparis tanakae TaxID=230148 RepID=A0A4Z2H723_9TELE|nr:hypothetical protein EYF80_028079 [Liparis tanakae]